jgi:hypothetical protein
VLDIAKEFRRSAFGVPMNTGLYVKSKNGLKLRDEPVRRLVRRMREALPWLQDSDMATCRDWAQLEILGAMIYAELRDKAFSTQRASQGGC